MKKLLVTVMLLLAVQLSARAEELVVGTNAEFPPFEFTDDNNNPIGYDIDIITAIGRAAGFTVRIQNQAFDTLIGGIESKQLDAAISGMTINDARKKVIDFSDPYYDAAQVIVVQEKTPGFTKIEDTKGKIVGVQLGTTGAGMAEEAMGKEDPNLKQFRKYNDVFNDLKIGRLDAIVVDLPVAQVYVKKIPGLKISSPPMSEEQYGVAVRKGNTALLNRLNDGLKKIRGSGEYEKITEKWFQN